MGVAAEHTVDNRECAKAVMEAFPLVFRHIRTEMMKAESQAFSMSQLRILTLLSDTPGVSLSEAADYMGVTPATASAIIERLVKRGIVSRVEDPKERRKVLLNLTKTGKHELQQMRDKMLNMVADLLVNVPTKDLSQICSSLNMLTKVLQSV